MRKIHFIIFPAILVIVIILFIVISYFFGLFDQDKCWDIGDQMAKGKPETIVISGEEAKELFGEDIDISASGTAEVGTAAYYHFKCHFDEQ